MARLDRAGPPSAIHAYTLSRKIPTRVDQATDVSPNAPKKPMASRFYSRATSLP